MMTISIRRSENTRAKPSLDVATGHLRRKRNDLGGPIINEIRLMCVIS